MPTFHGWPSLHTQWAMVIAAVGRVVAERPLADDVLQPPRPDLDAVLVADLQERAQARLQLARRPGQRPFRLQLAAGRPHLLVPQVGQTRDPPARSLRRRPRRCSPASRPASAAAVGSAGVSTTMTDFTAGGSSAAGQRRRRGVPRLGGGAPRPCRPRAGAVDDVVEQVAELLEHVAQRRLGAGDAVDLLVGEREDRRQLAEVGQFLQAGRSRASTTRRTRSGGGASRRSALIVPWPGTWIGLFSRSWM